MKYGKHVCKTLKAIRSEIAAANGIDYTPNKCTHKGDCTGTCPMCEQEVRWLEKQLRVRRALGKAVLVAGLSLSLGALPAVASTPSKSHRSHVSRILKKHHRSHRRSHGTSNLKDNRSNVNKPIEVTRPPKDPNNRPPIAGGIPLPPKGGPYGTGHNGKTGTSSPVHPNN